MKQEDDVLLYDKTTGGLMGVITCEQTGGKRTSLQFRVANNILVLRKELVTRVTDNLEQCPKSLLERFGGKAH